MIISYYECDNCGIARVKEVDADAYSCIVGRRTFSCPKTWNMLIRRSKSLIICPSCIISISGPCKTTLGS